MATCPALERRRSIQLSLRGPAVPAPSRFRYTGESQSLSRRRARADAEEGVPARFRIHAIPETDMHDPESDIRDIPLSQLGLSPHNVRKTPADASAFTELKASIAAHGLLENLIARAMEPGADGPGRYAVIAGGRRLAAMQALAAEGALDEDHPVPCRMIGAIVAAEEVSLAENSVRAAMHPADQVEAFRRLADAGSTAGAIAARFGVSERAGLAALAEFEAGPWGEKYPAIAQSWRRNWDHVIPFFAFPEAVRRMIYTTNAIELLNVKIRRAVRTRGHFPSDDAATKLLYLVLNHAAQAWKRQCPPGHPGLLRPGFQVAGSPRAPAGYHYEAKLRIASAGLSPASTAASLAALHP